MAEAVGLIASIITVVDLGLGTAQKIRKLAKEIKAYGKRLSRLARRVESNKRILDRLKAVIQTDINNTVPINLPLKEDIEIAVENCQDVFQDIDAACEDAARGTKIPSVLRKARYSLFEEAGIGVLLADLNQCQVEVNLILSIQWRSDAAQMHKEVLDALTHHNGELRNAKVPSIAQAVKHLPALPFPRQDTPSSKHIPPTAKDASITLNGDSEVADKQATGLETRSADVATIVEKPADDQSYVQSSPSASSMGLGRLRHPSALYVSSSVREPKNSRVPSAKADPSSGGRSGASLGDSKGSIPDNSDNNDDDHDDDTSDEEDTDTGSQKESPSQEDDKQNAKTANMQSHDDQVPSGGNTNPPPLRIPARAWTAWPEYTLALRRKWIITEIPMSLSLGSDFGNTEQVLQGLIRLDSGCAQTLSAHLTDNRLLLTHLRYSSSKSILQALCKLLVYDFGPVSLVFTTVQNAPVVSSSGQTWAPHGYAAPPPVPEENIGQQSQGRDNEDPPERPDEYDSFPRKRARPIRRTKVDTQELEPAADALIRNLTLRWNGPKQSARDDAEDGSGEMEGERKADDDDEDS